MIKTWEEEPVNIITSYRFLGIEEYLLILYLTSKILAIVS